MLLLFQIENKNPTSLSQLRLIELTFPKPISSAKEEIKQNVCKISEGYSRIRF